VQRILACPSRHCRAADAQLRALRYQGAYCIVAPLVSLSLFRQGHVICTTALGAGPCRLGCVRYLVTVSQALTKARLEDQDVWFAGWGETIVFPAWGVWLEEMAW